MRRFIEVVQSIRSQFAYSRGRLGSSGKQTLTQTVMINKKNSAALTLAVFVSFAVVTPARASEIDELKATIQSMQKNMEQMQERIAELEHENHKHKEQAAASRGAPTAPVAAAGAGSSGR